MATKKTDTKKKTTTKKKETKAKKVVEEVKEEVLEVVNGDPAVLEPVEENVIIEEPEKENTPIEEPEPQKEKIEVKTVTEVNVEKSETPIKKIKNKVNQYFGYFWNGQIIDF